MRKFKRTKEPDFLSENWEEWGKDWEQKRSSSKFYWHEIGGESVNHKLLPLLKELTQNHCSFCDAFPVSPPSTDTIEHFRPKAHFPRDAYRWENLYFSCMFCQGKGDDFDEALLRPDAEDYDFDRYFRWDYTTGELLVNEQGVDVDRERAKATIKLYRLNEGHPTNRKIQMLFRSNSPELSIDLFPYRHYIDGPIAMPPPLPP